MGESVRTNVAISLLMGTTREHYNEMRQECLKAYKLEEHDLPTFYYITKFRPKMDKGILDGTIECYKKLAREGKLKKETSTTDMTLKKKNKIEKRYFCKIKGTILDLMTHLFEKCERMFGVDFWKKSNNVYDNKLLVQLTADRSRHIEMQEGCQYYFFQFQYH